MQLNIAHKTAYSYTEPVPYGLLRLRQSPRSRTGQTVINWHTELKGGHEQVCYRDQFNNVTQLVSLDPETTELEIVASGEVETTDCAGVIGLNKGYAALWLYLRETPLTKKSRRLNELAREIAALDDENQVARMHALMALIAEHVEYGTGATDAYSTADEALEAGKGVCQDHTHIFVAVARLLKLPARYVSGFLMMDGQTHQAASHAWAEVHLDQIGWVGFDVSNRICPDERYVCVATGLDYRDAAPISGIRKGSASESLEVSVIVEQ